ncbi:Acyl transferase [Bienertia sinuspersici]
MLFLHYCLSCISLAFEALHQYLASFENAVSVTVAGTVLESRVRFLKSNALFMESQSHVKVSIRLGSEIYAVCGSTGSLSEQLILMKEESMNILKDYITKNNAPADVPDEPIEGSSEDEDEISKKPKQKKRK